MPRPFGPADTLSPADPNPNAGPRRAWAGPAFQVAARVEAATWIGLLLGMAFKYVLADDDLGVRVFGPLHGVAFIAYVLVTIVAARSFGWSWRLLLAGLLVSIPPAFTWPFERYVARRGHLGGDGASFSSRPGPS
ncbi:MAG: DUF3817 domain-containing protein [Nocardioides sp.]